MPLAIYILKSCPIKLNKSYIKLKAVPLEISILKRKFFPLNDTKRTNYKNIPLATVELPKEHQLWSVSDQQETSESQFSDMFT